LSAGELGRLSTAITKLVAIATARGKPVNVAMSGDEGVLVASLETLAGHFQSL